MKKFILIMAVLVGWSGIAAAGTALVDIDPDTLNLSSKGNNVTGYITAPEGCTPEEIIINTVAITEIQIGQDIATVNIPARSSPVGIADYNSDSVPELMVKFPRDALQLAIGDPGEVKVTIGGVCNLASFSGTDTINAINYLKLQAVADFPAGIKPRDVTIQSAAREFNLSNNGSLTLVDHPVNPFLVIATINGYPIALTFFEPGKDSNSISCMETAVSVVTFNTFLFAVPMHLISEALQLVREVPEVGILANHLCQELALSPDAMVTPSLALAEKLEDASIAVNDVLITLPDQYVPNIP